MLVFLVRSVGCWRKNFRSSGAIGATAKMEDRGVGGNPPETSGEANLLRSEKLPACQEKRFLF